MKFLTPLLLLLLLTACGEPATTPADSTDTLTEEEADELAMNVLTPQEVSEGWTLLFDGKTTDAWRGYNQESFPTRGWQVRDGELIVEHSGTEEDGFGGDIITRESFENFDLTLEFALTDTSNSGIFYLVKEVEGTPIWHNAPEFQLLDDETYKVTYAELTDAQLTGANYDMHPQTVNHSRPIGEWNTARIVKNGSHVQHFLNDKLVIEYQLHDEDWERRYQASKFKDFPDYARSTEGPIGLQDHGHLCRFRNIKIKRL